MLAYTIEAALGSGVCGEVMVSTESSEVADVARVFGADVPFMRPDVLSRDPHGVVDVCLHVLDGYAKAGKQFRTMVILLPTAPLRTPDDLRSAMRHFRDYGAQFLMTVSSFEHNPYGALQFAPSADGRVAPCFPEYVGRMANTLPAAYRHDGVACIVDVDAFCKARTYYGRPLHACVTNWPSGVDVDTAADFALAEYYLQKRKADGEAGLSEQDVRTSSAPPVP